MAHLKKAKMQTLQSYNLQLAKEKITMQFIQTLLIVKEKKYIVWINNNLQIK